MTPSPVTREGLSNDAPTFTSFNETFFPVAVSLQTVFFPRGLGLTFDLDFALRASEDELSGTADHAGATVNGTIDGFFSISTVLALHYRYTISYFAPYVQAGIGILFSSFELVYGDPSDLIPDSYRFSDVDFTVPLRLGTDIYLQPGVFLNASYTLTVVPSLIHSIQAGVGASF